jgi:hypothetical protein
VFSGKATYTNRAGNKSSLFASVLGWSYCLCPWFEINLLPLLLDGTFGLPLVLFPSGVQLSAMRGWVLASILSTWPMHCQRRFLIKGLILASPAVFLTSPLDIFIGQYILSMFNL